MAVQAAGNELDSNYRFERVFTRASFGRRKGRHVATLSSLLGATSFCVWRALKRKARVTLA
jgi:hypothetical protein